MPIAWESAPRRPSTDVGDEQTQGGAGEREQHALGEQMADQPPTSGAERQAHGELTRRDVERANIRLVRLAQAINSTRPTAPRSRNAAGRRSFISAAAHGVAASRQPSYSLNAAFSVCSHPAGNGRELGVRLGQRGARRKSRQHRELTAVARQARRIASPRDPQVGTDEEKTLRHDPNNRGGHPANADGPVDDGGIGPKRVRQRR